MSTHYFQDNSSNAFASVSVQINNFGEFLISQNCYPLSSMMCLPMQTAVNLATDILEIANAQIKAEA